MRDRELHVAHHAGETLLNELEFGDRLAELLSLRRVLNGSFVDACHAASGAPCDHEARGLKNLVRARGEVFRVSKLVSIRNEAVSQGDICVLSHTQSQLSLNFLG